MANDQSSCKNSSVTTQTACSSANENADGQRGVQVSWQQRSTAECSETSHVPRSWSYQPDLAAAARPRGLPDRLAGFCAGGAMSSTGGAVASDVSRARAGSESAEHGAGASKAG
jgi:hypothetical protein